MSQRLEQLKRLVALDAVLVKGLNALDFARRHGISQQMMRSDLDVLRGLGAEIEMVQVAGDDGKIHVQRYKRGRSVFSDWLRKAND